MPPDTPNANNAEVSALRDLLDAVRELASVPVPVVGGDLDEYYRECVQSLGMITRYATGETAGVVPGATVNILQGRARRLRERAARPLRYTPESPQAES